MVRSAPVAVLGSALGEQQSLLGRLSVGGVADLCVVDPAASWVVTPDALRSQGIELTFTTQPGVNAVVQGLPQTLYSMHRITMTEDTNMDEFLAELAK